jgi:succinate dehydrogenase/fumarate reductase flavoprotein subunit
LVIGSGAAGLNAAVQLRHQGVEDLLIVTGGLKMGDLNIAAHAEIKDVLSFLGRCETADNSWRMVCADLQERMSKAGACFRSLDSLKKAVKEAKAQLAELEINGCKMENAAQAVQALRNRQLCFAHWIPGDRTVCREEWCRITRIGDGSRCGGKTGP